MLRTFIVFWYLGLATPLFVSLAALSLWVDRSGRFYDRFSRIWARGILRLGGIRVELRGRMWADPERQYVFMANHQSLLDVACLVAVLPFRLRFVAKASLFRIPIFGWALARGGHVRVDRSDRAQAIAKGRELKLIA